MIVAMDEAPMKNKVLILTIIIALTVIVRFLASEYLEEQHESKEITLFGNVDIRDVSLGFRVGGKIANLYFEEGDVVTPNTILAELDPQPLMQELELREAELDEAKAFLKNANKTFERNTKLLNTGSISQGAYDDALATRDEAWARVNTSKARLALTKTTLEDAKLKSPSAGIILTRIREVGSIVEQGAPVYTLALNDPVWIRTYVNEPKLGFIYPGQAAQIITDSGGKYQGQIGFISPQAEFTPKNVETAELRTDLVYRLRVIVKNPDHGLRQGMPVTIKVEKGA